MIKKKFTMQKKLHRLGEMLIGLVGRLFPDYNTCDILRDVQISIFPKIFQVSTYTCNLSGFRSWCQIIGPENAALRQ